MTIKPRVTLIHINTTILFYLSIVRVVPMLLQYNAHAPTPNTLPPSLTHSLAVSLSTSFSSCYLSLSLSLAPPPSFIRPLRTLFTHCLIFNMYSCAYIFNPDVSLIWIIYSPKHDLKFDFKHTCYIINLKFTTSFIAISICLQPRTNIFIETFIQT